MIRDRIDELLRAAIEAAQRGGKLPKVAVPDLDVERPRQAEHGDYATGVALRLARAAQMKPIDIAERIAAAVPADPAIASVGAVPPGFVNVTLRDDWLRAQLALIRAEGDSFGESPVASPERVQIEFISANPVGPIHVGNGRGGVFGDVLASVLAARGHQVHREYYINDAGTQIQVFARTLHARYLQALGEDTPLPDDGYGGAYMVDLASALAAEHGGRFRAKPEADALRELAEIGMRTVLGWIRADAEALGIRFDTWFSERSLFERGLVDLAIQQLRDGGNVLEREGAIWFASAALGEDKDNVIIRSTGAPTYFATDIAYHYDKFANRRFDRVVDIWGADHQGHVSRMKAVVGALGFDSERLTVLLSQLVTLKRGGETVRLSKRTGDIITLREVVDEVGADACRYFFLQRSANSQMDFDLELAKDQSDKNPVYYIQYAHARIASILRRAAELGLEWQDSRDDDLAHPAELALIRRMLELPERVALAAEQLAPQHLPEYAYRLAAAFTDFYHHCSVLGDDVPPSLRAARLRLCEAAGISLRNTLRIMGMSAPDRMAREADSGG